MLIINMAIFLIILCCAMVNANVHSSEHEERQQILAEIREYFDKKISVLEETHTSELIKLQEYYKAEITKNEEKHKTEIKAVEEKLLREINVLKKDMTSDRIQQVKEINSIKQKLETEQQNFAEPAADLKLFTRKSRKRIHHTEQHVNAGDNLHTVRAVKRRGIEDTKEKTQSRKRQLGISTRVAFFASISNDTHLLGTHQDIKFDNAVTNIGTAYNPHHGMFIAPVAGVYLFSVTLSHPLGSSSNGHIMKNGQILAKLGFAYYDGQSSQTVIIELEKGDDISVENDKTDGHGIKGDRHSTFAGFLIYEYSATTAMPLVVGK